MTQSIPRWPVNDEEEVVRITWYFDLFRLVLLTKLLLTCKVVKFTSRYLITIPTPLTSHDGQDTSITNKSLLCIVGIHMCRFGQGFPLEAVLSTIKLQIRNGKKTHIGRVCVEGGDFLFTIQCSTVLLFCSAVWHSCQVFDT